MEISKWGSGHRVETMKQGKGQAWLVLVQCIPSAFALQVDIAMASPVLSSKPVDADFW